MKHDTAIIEAVERVLGLWDRNAIQFPLWNVPEGIATFQALSDAVRDARIEQLKDTMQRTG